MIDNRKILETLKHSITRKLLIVVFSVYVCLTISIALIHMYLEYNHAIKLVEKEIINFQEIIHDRLADALWNSDKEKMTTLLNNVTKSSFVEGAKVESKDFQIFSNSWYTENIKNKSTKQSGFFSGLIEHKFDIFYKDRRGILHKIGNITLYSTNKIVFNQVEFKFFLILLDSIIKTFAVIILFLVACFVYISRPLNKLKLSIQKISQDELFNDNRIVCLKGPNINDTEIEFMLKAYNEIIDILRKINNKLNDAQARMVAIINSMPSIIIGVTRDGVITDWNLLAEKETGIKTRDAIGINITDVFDGTDKCMDIARNAMLHHTMEIECKVPIKIKGENKYFDIISYPINTNKLDCAIIRIDDVTHKMYLDDFIFQNEKMSSLGNLAAGVAHEINNPLENIIQGGQNFLRRIDPSISSNQKIAEELGINIEQIYSYMKRRGLLKFINGIKESGERASTIMEHLLQFSKKSSAEKVRCYIPDIIDNVLKLIYADVSIVNIIDLNKIQINKDIESNVEEIECCDTEIEQVLFNVIKNAVFAVRNKKKPIISIKVLKEADTIGIEIEDNGEGMLESVRKRVFEPFFTTRNVGEGSGLGLSICYTIIVENHHGSISVQSYNGLGTTVLINLPIFHRDLFGANFDHKK